MNGVNIPGGNIEVYRYLLGLIAELESSDHLEIAEEVRRVAKNAIESPSEFFERVETLLKSLQIRFSDVLSVTQNNSMASWIEQIDEAFRRIGGA